MTLIEDLIYALDMARYRLTDNVPNEMDPDMWSWTTKQALDALAWYIRTGRASMDTIRSIRKCRLYNLLRSMSLSKDLSTSGLIKAMHIYLKRNRKE